MPEIIVLSGPPCSGKSTFTKQYPEYYVLSRDVFRDQIFGKNYQFTKYNEDHITRVFNVWFRCYVTEGYNIILDNTHCKQAYLDNWIKRKPKGYTMRIIFFQVSLWKLHLRNIGRRIMTGKWIPIRIMNDMQKNFKKIKQEKYDLVY